MSPQKPVDRLIHFRLDDQEKLDFKVLKLDGEELLNELYVFKLIVAFDGKRDTSPFSLLKKATIFYPTHTNLSYYYHGVITKYKYLGVQPPYSVFKVEIRPYVWQYTIGKNRRVYQKMSVDEIAKQVFKNIKFEDYSFQLKMKYPKSDYITQYDESEFDFISRLFQAHGIFYYFNHEKKSSKMIISDSDSDFQEVGDQSFKVNALTLKENLNFFVGNESLYTKEIGDLESTTLSSNTKTSLNSTDVNYFFKYQKLMTSPMIQEKLTIGKVTVADYNYETSTSELIASSKDNHGPDVELFEYPAGFKQPSEKDGLAQIRLGSFTYSKFIMRAKVFYPVKVASKIKIEDDPGFERKNIKGKVFKILKVTHHFNKQGYDCRIEAIPEAAKYIPPITFKKP
ncbi:MAG: hypothetical protein K2X39_05590, partial [Silvanigrellaceae bacterium]|nr:hypothetical protein [Silvanigrellaceae bacterium]